MSYKLVFKVAAIDAPDAPIEDNIVCIDFEPAHLDTNLRTLIRSRINMEVMMRGVIEDVLTYGNVPLNYWSPLPMAICRGHYHRETENIIAQGTYDEHGKWNPDLLIASAPSIDALIDALLDDDERIENEIARVQLRDLEAGEDGQKDQK